MHDGMWGYAPMGWGWIAVILWSVIGIALLVLIVLAIVRIWSGPATFHASAPREDEALALLKQRYARGEIDREEFEQKRRDLRS